MKIYLEKASGKAKCRNSTCSKDPELIDASGRIKKDTTCAWISISSAGGYASACYCRKCIEILHDNVRHILNPKLWVLT